MKIHIGIIVLLTIATSSHGGYIDGFFDKVKNTTTSIKSNIGGAFNYGKRFVFGSETNDTGRLITEPGIVGKVSMKIHDVSHAVREEFRSVLTIFDNKGTHPNGIVSGIIDKIKNRFTRVKQYVLHENPQVEYNPKPLDKDTAVLRDQIKKYLMKHNSTANVTNMFHIQEVLNNLYLNVTNKIQPNKNGEHDGSGLIDVRYAVNDIAGGVQDDLINGIYTANDKINEEVEAIKPSIQTDTIVSNTNNFIQNEKDKVEKNIDNVNNKLTDFSNKVKNSLNDVGNRVRDESDKVKELVMKNAYSKVDNN